MTIEMHDPDAFGRAFRDPAHCRIADGMVAADDDRHGPGRKDMRTGTTDLIEALFDIAGNGEDIAGIAQRHLFAQIDSHFIVVGRVERRNLAQALRPETRPRTIGRAPIEGHAQHGRVILADLLHILRIGRLQEGVDPGVMRQFPAREGRDRLVVQRIRSGQAHAQGPGLFLVPFAFGQFRLVHHGGPAAQFGQVGVMLARRRRIEVHRMVRPAASSVRRDHTVISSTVSIDRD